VQRDKYTEEFLRSHIATTKRHRAEVFELIDPSEGARRAYSGDDLFERPRNRALPIFERRAVTLDGCGTAVVRARMEEREEPVVEAGFTVERKLPAT
jgi:hypothetical protein